MITRAPTHVGRADRAAGHARRPALIVAVAGLLSCADASAPGRIDEPAEDGLLQCDIPLEELFDGGVGRDGIAALSAPELVAAADPETAYLRPDDRVVGLLVDGQAVAVPLNILWFHEIVNLQIGGRRLAVTHCPLTGSSLVFDRGVVGGAEFGVSGLIFRNNLILFDRTGEPSLWPQMASAAACGPLRRTPLTQHAASEVTWSGWRRLHPDTRVVRRPPALVARGATYTLYPYGDYGDVDNLDLLFPQRILDARRPRKERVVGVPLGGDGGTAIPFGELAGEALAAVRVPARGGGAVLLWSRELQGGSVFRTQLGEHDLTFRAQASGFRDEQTGSSWGLDGVALAGPLAGARLEPHAEAYVAYWFAWAAFQPETTIWRR